MRATIYVILSLLLILSSNVHADLNRLEKADPSTELAPDQVVRIVVDALRSNDSAAGDNGIATVWRFAAPSNKAVTGPLERFTNMIKGGFGDMLNHIDSDFGPIEIEDDLATQPVWLTTETGDEVGYIFRIRLQDDGEFKGMWMTEAVYPLAPKTPGTSI